MLREFAFSERELCLLALDVGLLGFNCIRPLHPLSHRMRVRVATMQGEITLPDRDSLHTFKSPVRRKSVVSPTHRHDGDNYPVACSKVVLRVPPIYPRRRRRFGGPFPFLQLASEPT